MNKLKGGRMKLIEAMKKIKELQIKAEDYRKKVAQYHADLSFETPMYGADQKSKIKDWIQGHSDILKEILGLRVTIQRTNLQTRVDIQIGDKTVTKTIAEWIHRRRDLAEMEQKMWEQLNDKDLKEGQMKNTSGEPVDVRIRRYYDPQERDNAIEIYRSEPGVIDRTLEVVNAITEVIA